MGSWVTPRVIDWALRADREGVGEGQPGLRRVDVLLTPTIAHRPPKVGILDGTGTVGSALRALPAIAYVALWNVAGNPAAAVPVRDRARRAADRRCSWSAATDDETHAARAWPRSSKQRSPLAVSAVGRIGSSDVSAHRGHDLAMAYGELRAVDGVSFEVAEGEFFGILGPNGAGKTTTLEMIEGLRKPDAGTDHGAGPVAVAAQRGPAAADRRPAAGVVVLRAADRPRADPHLRRAVRRARPRAATSGWSGSGWSTRPTPGSRTSPAARRSGCRSPARWCTTPRWSSSTSRPPRSTRRPAATCGTCSPGSTTPAAPSC